MKNTPIVSPGDGSRPLKIMFATTSLPVGGAETLLVNLVRTLDRRRFAPEVICLKEPGPLGDELAHEMPVHRNLIHHKFDLLVVARLRRLFRQRQADGLITVGAGDKMFWGRIAARLAGVPVILSALHSTGWPDGVGRLNRLLTPITDGFIAVASSHREYLIERERFPAHKVFLIPNGIDTQRFEFDLAARQKLRSELGIADRERVVGIVAALRPEKDHELFLHAARAVLEARRDTRFWIVGDGPQRAMLERMTAQLGIQGQVSFFGSRHDIPAILSAIDLFALTSKMEASPVSILEAMACERPVAAPQVGSIGDSLEHEVTGLLVSSPSVTSYAQAWLRILSDDGLARSIGRAAREHVVQHGSLEAMTRGYEEMVSRLYQAKTHRSPPAARPVAHRPSTQPVG